MADFITVQGAHIINPCVAVYESDEKQYDLLVYGNGGYVIATGTPKELKGNEKSIIGRYLK